MRRYVVTVKSRPHGRVLADLSADGGCLRPTAGIMGAVGVGAVLEEAKGGEGAVGDEERIPGDDEATHVLVQVWVDVGARRVATLLAPDVHSATWYRHVVGALLG